MSVWGWIALICLAIWIFDFVHNEKIKHAETKTLKMAYEFGYIAIGTIILLGALLELGLISIDSQITWLIVMLPIITLAMIALGMWHRSHNNDNNLSHGAD